MNVLRLAAAATACFLALSAVAPFAYACSPDIVFGGISCDFYSVAVEFGIPIGFYLCFFIPVCVGCCNGDVTTDAVLPLFNSWSLALVGL